MSSLTTPVPNASGSLAHRVRPVRDSRPTAITWRPAVAWPVPPDQPPLDLTAPAEVDLGQPRGKAIVTLVRARWTVRPRRNLPDAGEWGASLAVAMLQALLSQRPIAQLNRWLSDDVLSLVSRQQRRRRTERDRAVWSVLLRSLRVQHPGAEVAEVSAHVVIGNRDTAVAFRLEALGERWLCTALEFDVRVLR